LENKILKEAYNFKQLDKKQVEDIFYKLKDLLFEDIYKNILLVKNRKTIEDIKETSLDLSYIFKVMSETFEKQSLEY